MGSRLRPTGSSKGKGIVPVVLIALFIWCSQLAAQAGGFCLGPSMPPSSRKAREAQWFQSETMALYEVKKGDRLADIARLFYGDPGKGWMIEDANESVDITPGQILVIPLRPTNPGGLYADGYQMVPILTYHHFSSHCTTALCMPLDSFRRQMDFLKREGYRTVTMGQVLKFVQYQEPLPRKAVAITIDDGYRSFYEMAYPVMKKYDFKATLFIYTDFIDSGPNALTWEQLRLLSDAGFEVQSHTISHTDLTRRLKGESEAAYHERIREELKVPRRLISEKVGQQPLWLAYPYGHYNNLVISMAQDAGYQGAVTVRRQSNPFFTDPFRLGRYQVMSTMQGRSFAVMLETFRPEALR